MNQISVEQKITWAVRVDGRTVSEHATLQEAMNRKSQFLDEARRFEEFMRRTKTST